MQDRGEPPFNLHLQQQQEAGSWEAPPTSDFSLMDRLPIFPSNIVNSQRIIALTSSFLSVVRVDLRKVSLCCTSLIKGAPQGGRKIRQQRIYSTASKSRHSAVERMAKMINSPGLIIEGSDDPTHISCQVKIGD